MSRNQEAVPDTPAAAASRAEDARILPDAEREVWLQNMAGFEGREVSCRALGIFFDELEARPEPPSVLADGTGYSLDHLLDNNERISWVAYRVFMGNVAQIWSEADLVAMGEKFFRSPLALPTALVARLLYTPLEFYRTAARPGLRSGRQISCIQPFIQELGEDQILYTIKLHPDYAQCRGFWFITKGVLTGMPTVMALPPAKVEMTLQADGAQYLIQLPAGGGWLAWLRRLVTRPFTGRAAARELERANVELQRQYLRLQAQVEERTRAEMAAKEARAFLLSAIENMRDGFVLFDAEDRLILCNKQFERLYPRMLEQIRPGAKFTHLVRAAMESGQIALVKGRDGGSYYEERMRAWREGEVIQYRTSEGRWVEARDNVIAGGGRIGIRVDITERMEVAAELEALVGELEQKNSELERFTYTVSHDLKSPLVTVNGFLGFLKRDLAAGNEARAAEDIAHIQEATRKMQMLLDDLLDLSRIGRVTDTPEWIPFSDLVAEALQVVTGRLDETGAAVIVQPQLPTVFVDQRRLVDVLQNLIDNAAKFSAQRARPQIEIGYGAQAGGHAFFVRDNGIGIPERYHEQVFGLFNRLDDSVEGTGVGLTLVRRIIQAHEGRVWLDSAGDGQGTTVWFTLPVRDVA